MSREKKSVVYGLFCVCEGCQEAKPDKIRYVGITVEGLQHRLKSHINESRTGSKKAKDRWIRKHGSENIRGVVLEEVKSGIEDLKVAEISWIERLGTFQTPEGLNMTRGGDGIWGYTFSDEVREAFRARTAKQFEENLPQAKVTEEDAREIIKRIWAGETTAEIAKDYPISVSAVQKIREGKNWPKLPRPEGKPPTDRSRVRRAPKVPRETVEKVRSRFTGEWGSQKQLAEEFGICETTVSLILNKRGRYAVVE